MKIKPLRKFPKQYFCQPIPSLAWTQPLTQLFEDMKRSIATSPVLSRFDVFQLTFLKIDWSSHSMVWILIHPESDTNHSK